MQRPQDLVAAHRDQKSWYKISNASGAKNAPAEVYIYGYIGWDVTAARFIQELADISAAKMNVHIATNGGDVYDGIAIMNAMRGHSAEVTTIVDAQALSAGSYIMQAGVNRLMMPNSTVMIHDASAGLAYAEGNASDLREFATEVLKYADVLDATSMNIASIYAERAGGTPEMWRAVMQEEKWYTAVQAVEAGLADEVVSFDTGNSLGVKPAAAVVPPTPEPEVPAEPHWLDFTALTDSLRKVAQ